jgi:hypothetical protein
MLSSRQQHKIKLNAQNCLLFYQHQWQIWIVCCPNSEFEFVIFYFRINSCSRKSCTNDKNWLWSWRYETCFCKTCSYTIIISKWFISILFVRTASFDLISIYAKKNIHFTSFFFRINHEKQNNVEYICSCIFLFL